MHVVVLAAGYATRLRPLTDTVAKPLLPLAGRPMLDYLADKIDEVGGASRRCTSSRTRASPRTSRRGRRSRAGRLPVRVHDDGTSSNTDRLGAIGDLRFVIERAGPRGRGSAGGRRRQPLRLLARGVRRLLALAGRQRDRRPRRRLDLALARQYGVVELDGDDRVVSLVEKPEQPASTLASIAAYLFTADHAALVGEYLADGERARPAGALRRLALSARAGVRLQRSRATGWTSATSRSCSRPTTACACGGPARAGRVQRS